MMKLNLVQTLLWNEIRLTAATVRYKMSKQGVGKIESFTDPLQVPCARGTAMVWRMYCVVIKKNKHIEIHKHRNTYTANKQPQIKAQC